MQKNIQKMKKIAQVKIGISRLSAGSKTLIGKKVVGCMRNNPHFANPIPSLAIIETATNELSDALKALDGWCTSFITFKLPK